MAEPSQDILRSEDQRYKYASRSRWRHEESTAFAKHAGVNAAPAAVRDADERVGVPSGLASFLNENRIEPSSSQGAVQEKFAPILVDGHGDGSGIPHSGPDAIDKMISTIRGDPADEKLVGGAIDGREVRCGPLLNFRRIDGPMWHGSVLIVIRGGFRDGEEFGPVLKLAKAKSEIVDGRESNEDGELADQLNGINGSKASSSEGIGSELSVDGVKLYSDRMTTFWRFSISVEMEEAEVKWEYRIPGLRFPKGGKTDKQSFFVPAVTESMRIMFHSCNGFSVGTDESAWSGPALWNDVQRVHKETPLHVMIGGGDQVYNDGIRVSGPLRPWSDMGNPKKRRDCPFPEHLRKDCDTYYVANYIRWYSTEPFAGANGQIPQLNIWDDHDIIDGFGSYVAEFMRCDVFRGIGGVAYKYYMLFQHHLPPPACTYTTDAPQTMSNDGSGVGVDPEQAKDTYVLKDEEEDPSYIIGDSPGPYVQERSRSIYARLGARIAFFGIDARTERTRHQVNYPDTYRKIIDRLRKELGNATSSPSPVKHLIVLLGIPIAYPRLTWLENIFSSPLMGPIKFLNKRFGFAGGLMNKFDGNVDLLDDLDDHYTAKTHKKERLNLMVMLQELAAEFSVRITIVSGDVHLAAVGRFYSNPKLKIPVASDHRYMVNVVSSAIVNKPPPAAIANFLAKRNKIHHLNDSTDETLLYMFDRDPGKTQKTLSSNHVTMPSRNWAMITENSAASASHPTTNGTGVGTDTTPNGLNGASNVNGNHTNHVSESVAEDEATGKDGHSPLGPGEEMAGTKNRAASKLHGKAGDGSLDVCVRIEKDQHDKDGNTQSYGMWIPALHMSGGVREIGRKRDVVKNHAHIHKENVVHRVPGE